MAAGNTGALVRWGRDFFVKGKLGVKELQLYPSLVTKKISTSQEVIKISVTNTNIYYKNYLIFTKNSEKKFAVIIDNLIKNKEKKVYSTFVIVTLSLSLLLSSIHSILSPICKSSIWAIGLGILVRTELLLVFPFDNFVFCLNNTTILSNLFLTIIIYILLTI